MKYGAELGRAGVALLLASALWLVVSAEETTAEWVPVNVTLKLDTAAAPMESPQQVRAFVVGRRRDLFKLMSTPPTIQRASTENDRDSVRIELRAQDIDMPGGIEVSVRDVRPRLVTFHLRQSDPPAQDILVPRRTDSDMSADEQAIATDSIVHARKLADSVARAKHDSTRRDSTRRDSITRRPPS